jgi:hypothetical protein
MRQIKVVYSFQHLLQTMSRTRSLQSLNPINHEEHKTTSSSISSS